MNPPPRRIRYAIVGAGNISQVAVLPAFERATNSELVALVSGDATKRGALCRQYGLSVHGDYDHFEDILERGKIDAVYIATPNSLHREFAVRAAHARVHVLCEKPLAPTGEDCDAIGSACQASGVRAMVAYRLHFEEATLTALKRVREGEIGKPRVFSSVFGHVVRDGDIRGDATLGGGALLDLGIYCINAARNVFGQEPDRAYAVATRKHGVDETTVAVLGFGTEGVAQFTVSNGISQVSSYRICGTEGELRVEPGFEYATEIVHHLSVAGGTRRERFARCDQFAAELHYFSRCILEGTDPEPSIEEARLDARVTDALFESLNTGKQIDLAPATRERRPSFSQVYRIAPGGEPTPVLAPSPVVR